MTSTAIITQMLDLFERLDIAHMLVGGYSSNYYGRPRSTKDADFVVILPSEKLTRLGQMLENGLHLDPQMSFESITMTMRYIVSHPDSIFKVELFVLSDDPFDQSRFTRRRKVDFQGRMTWLPMAEDVLIQKMRWSRQGKRSKDLQDAREIVQVRKAELDQPYIRKWTDIHQTTDLFEHLLANASSTERPPQAASD